MTTAVASTKRIISALVQDHPGVLTRVSSMFRRRGFNITSLAVGQSEQPGFSRMTIVVDGVAADMSDQITKQLYNVIEVVKATDITEESMVAKEIAMVKVRATASTRGEILQIVDIFKAEIVDVSSETMIIEVAGASDQVDSMIGLLLAYGVREIMRTGQIAMTRGG